MDNAPVSGQLKSLEARWWYRLLRVVLFLTYALTLVVTLGMIYSESHPHPVLEQEKSFISCDDGKAYPFSQLGYIILSRPGEQLASNDAGGW